MTKLGVNRFLQSIILTSACVLSATLGLSLRSDGANTAKIETVSSARQFDEKIIKRQERVNEPIEIGDISIRGMKLALNQKFRASSLQTNTAGQLEDWLEKLTFKIRNKSDKKITYINFCLVFPETAAYGPQMVYNLNIGSYPKATQTGKANAISLDSGDATIFTLPDQQLGQIKKFLSLKSFNLSYLNEATIRVDYVIFSDGMKWDQGFMYEPDPNEPDKFIKVKSQK